MIGWLRVGYHYGYGAAGTYVIIGGPNEGCGWAGVAVEADSFIYPFGMPGGIGEKASPCMTIARESLSRYHYHTNPVITR